PDSRAPATAPRTPAPPSRPPAPARRRPIRQAGARAPLRRRSLPSGPLAPPGRGRDRRAGSARAPAPRSASWPASAPRRSRRRGQAVAKSTPPICVSTSIRSGGSPIWNTTPGCARSRGVRSRTSWSTNARNRSRKSVARSIFAPPMQPPLLYAQLKREHEALVDGDRVPEGVVRGVEVLRLRGARTNHSSGGDGPPPLSVGRTHRQQL